MLICYIVQQKNPCSQNLSHHVKLKEKNGIRMVKWIHQNQSSQHILLFGILLIFIHPRFHNWTHIITFEAKF